MATDLIGPDGYAVNQNVPEMVKKDDFNLIRQQLSGSYEPPLVSDEQRLRTIEKFRTSQAAFEAARVQLQALHALYRESIAADGFNFTSPNTQTLEAKVLDKAQAVQRLRDEIWAFHDDARNNGILAAQKVNQVEITSYFERSRGL